MEVGTGGGIGVSTLFASDSIMDAFVNHSVYIKNIFF